MWIFKATLTSVIIMTMTENDYLDAPRQDGKISGYASFGDFVYTCIVLTVNIKILVSSKSIDSGIVLTTILSIVMLYISRAVISFTLPIFDHFGDF